MEKDCENSCPRCYSTGKDITYKGDVRGPKQISFKTNCKRCGLKFIERHRIVYDYTEYDD